MSKRAEKIHFAGGIHGAPSCGSSPRPTTKIVSSTRNTERVTCRSCVISRHFRDAVKGKISKLSTDNQKRAKVYAAGATPVIGPAMAIHQAARNAPQGQKASAGALQGAGWGGGYAVGAAGGAHIAARAARNPAVGAKMDAFSTGVRSRRQAVADKLPGFAGRRVAPKTGPGRVGRAVTGLAEKPGAVGRFTKPLAARPGAAALGGISGKIIGAGVGGYAGYSEALRREHSKAAKLNSVSKASSAGTGMTAREQREQLKRKRHNLGVAMVSTGLGAAGAGLLAGREVGPHLPRIGGRIARHSAGLERAGLGTALAGGGVGAVQGAQSIRIQRRDLAAQEKVLSKAYGVPRQATFRASSIRRVPSGKLIRVANTVAKARSDLNWPTTREQRSALPFPQHRRHVKPLRRANSASEESRFRAYMKPHVRPMYDGVREIGKLDTTMSNHDAQRVKAQYGTRGPLPAGLPREEKMRAYEGRYIASGGKKGEHWQRRSDDLDHVTGATIAGAVGAYGAKRAAENPRTAGRLVRRGISAEHLAHRSGRVAESLGAAGALSELAHRHAQHKASSYRSSPAGVAASSLKRLRDYTP